MVQTSPGDSSILANKLESMEESQALEKDKQDIASKQMGVRLELIKGLIKNLMLQNQEKPSSNFIQNVGNGRFGN